MSKVKISHTVNFFQLATYFVLQRTITQVPVWRIKWLLSTDTTYYRYNVRFFLPLMVYCDGLDCFFCLQDFHTQKSKCMLKLQVERNLEGDVSHTSPDLSVLGGLSSVHWSIDLNQFTLIRSILDHNLGEQLEEFYQKPLMSTLQDPKIQVRTFRFRTFP